MYEEKGRMLTEIKKLKQELTDALDQNATLSEKLFAVQDSVKVISSLRETIQVRESTIG